MTPASRRALRVLLALGVFVAALAGLRLWIMHVVCTRAVLQVERLPGLTIEITDLSCDLLEKDESINVYVEKAVPPNAWFWSRWRDHRVLLFSYFPYSENTPLPSVTRPSESRILISVPMVSSIIRQHHRWEGLSVAYSIGYVEYH